MKLAFMTVLGAPVLLVAAGASAQWSDSFDTYADGSAVVGQGGWEMWGGGAAPHGIVTSAEATHGPQSLEVINGDDIVQTYDEIAGAWQYRAMMLVPAEAAGAQTWFVMLNTYPATVNPDWSVALVFDPNAGTVTSWDGATLPLAAGAWTEIRVVINLDDDHQDIYYGGELLTSKTWTGGVGEGGVARIHAVDLYAPQTEYSTYWDDLSLVEVDPVGACCLISGECIPDLGQADCEATEGFYKYNGIGSTCASAFCPAYVPGEGWQVEAPFGWDGDTTFQAQECSLGDANDETFAVTIPYAAPWTFSLCADDTIDSYLAIGSAPCTDDLGEADDSCGVQPEITLDLEPGVVYVTVTSLFGEEGAYRIDVTAPCITSIDPVGDPEGEACGTQANDGCNQEPPAFEAIALGQTIAGTDWMDGASRDTDWYEFTTLDGNLRWAFVGRTFDEDIILCGSGFNDYMVTIDQAAAGADVEMTVTGESVQVFGMIADDAGAPSTDCVTAAFIDPAFFTSPCDGTITVTGVIEAGAACTPSLGDANGDGVVNVEDLLTVLGDWGCTGSCAGDTTCDDVTDVSDLLDVLGNWS